MGRFDHMGPCLTMQYGVRGAHGGLRVMPSQLESEFGVTALQANHLVSTYGNRSFEVLKNRSIEPLVDGWPYVEAEVDYCLREELVQVPDDFVSRRIRVGFCDAYVSGKVEDRVKERLSMVGILARVISRDASRE
jgi:glycerol-3-phosphate dehydrogenase